MLISQDISRAVQKDLRTLARFTDIYCRAKHGGSPRQVFVPPGFPGNILRRPVPLCPACAKLLLHAWVKRVQCPMSPKPACKHCPRHCYHPEYRARMREVMRYSSRAILLRGRLDYLFRILF